MEDRQKNNPFKDGNTFHTQVSNVLGDDFWQDIAEIIPITGPRIDIYYTSSTVVVLAELPGLGDANQIGIHLQGQMLVIEGELPRIYPATENQITQRERFFGSFRRMMSMPKPVTTEGIRAKYSQGLLTVELLIEQHTKSTQIQIDVES